MLSVLENPAVRERVPACSVENYHRLYELGVLAERLELIRGAIIEKMPQSPSHACVVEMLREHLEEVLPPEFFVRQEKPLTLADSEPEPDLAVIAGQRSDYRHSHPSSAALVIEVAISTEALDRVKLEIYAEAGVPECWLILPGQQQVECYSGLQAGRYTTVRIATYPSKLVSHTFSNINLPTDELFQS
jgi:Uma2 family endonuclease